MLLKDKVTESSERIQLLGSYVSNNQSAVVPNEPAAASNKIPNMYTITSNVALMLQEEREKDRRKINLIIHGIFESTFEIPVERKDHDTELLVRVIPIWELLLDLIVM